MEFIKKVILKSVIKQVRKTAQAAAGTASHWGMYQPEEPKKLLR